MNIRRCRSIIMIGNVRSDTLTDANDLSFFFPLHLAFP